MSLDKGNYYVVQSFMVTELKLKGIEKELYAIIWGFSQGDNTFNGSLGYLSEWTGYTKQRICDVLKKMVKRGLLAKKEIFRDGQKLCVYKAVAPENKAEGSKMGLEIDFDYETAKDSSSSEKALKKASRGLRWKNKKVEVYKQIEANPFALCGSEKTMSEIDKLYERKDTITKEQFVLQRAMLMEKLGANDGI